MANAPRARALAVAGGVALVAWMAFELPWQSHIQFPARYLAGFPGERTSEPERGAFLEPARDALHRAWGLRSFAAAHLGLLRTLSKRFIGVRAEEHARFLATVVPEGRRLRVLVEQGTLPSDTYIATGAVGAIPYYSGLRTLDRLGLTDAVIARSTPQRARVMAHDRSASFEDARTRGVDLWPVHDVHFLWSAGEPHVLDLVARRVKFFAAETGPDEFLLVMLPQGLARTAQRFSGLRFEHGTSGAFLERWLERGTALLRDSLNARDDHARRRQLAYLLLLQGRMAEAMSEYERILAHAPGDPELLLYASYCREALGQKDMAREELERARATATARGDEPLAARITRRLDELSAAR